MTTASPSSEPSGRLHAFDALRGFAMLLGIFLHAACLIAGAIYTWLMVFGVTGFFLRYANWPSRTIRYLADSSYWLYLTHLPLVLFLQKLWATSDWSSFTKFTLINAITLAALGLSYHFLVRHTFIGALLNGTRLSVTRHHGSLIAGTSVARSIL